MHVTWYSLIAAAVAACATVLGGSLAFVRKEWDHEVLRYSISFGAGFMLAAAALAMIPESLKLTTNAPLYFLAGYLTIHFFEHTIVPHFHFGEETHEEVMANPMVGYSSIFGLSIHTLFDGISIGSGFLVSPILGSLIFGAVVLHKLPEGFTIASIMLASGHKPKGAVTASVILGTSTLLGALLISFFRGGIGFSLPFSAGVTFYVAATDLVPIVNENKSIRYSFAFFAGILIFYISELVLSRYLL